MRPDARLHEVDGGEVGPGHARTRRRAAVVGLELGQRGGGDDPPGGQRGAAGVPRMRSSRRAAACCAATGCRSAGQGRLHRVVPLGVVAELPVGDLLRERGGGDVDLGGVGIAQHVPRRPRSARPARRGRRPARGGRSANTSTGAVVVVAAAVVDVVVLDVDVVVGGAAPSSSRARRRQRERQGERERRAERRAHGRAPGVRVSSGGDGAGAVDGGDVGAEVRLDHPRVGRAPRRACPRR